MKKDEKHLNTRLTERPSRTGFPTSEEIRESSFKAMNAVQLDKRQKHARIRVKALNRLRARAFGEAIEAKLNLLSKQFQKIDTMNPFYLDLMGAIVDIARLKQNLAFLRSSSRLIKKLRYEAVKGVYGAGDDAGANRAVNGFIARSCSILKKLTKPLAQLKEDSKKMDYVPSIEFGVPTIVLSGFPNVGKSTILGRLTTAKPEVAPYAFTTKGINSGFMEVKYQRVQVLDTPGLLDRKITPEQESKGAQTNKTADDRQAPGVFGEVADENPVRQDIYRKRNEIERKSIAALNHLANIIVFVADTTINSGYELHEQVTLYRQIKEEFAGKKIIVALNKADLATPEEIEAAKKEFLEAGQGNAGADDIVLEGQGGEYMGQEGTGALMKRIEKAVPKA
ncbi:GTPase Obg [uncultured archaeon]|nr:GTPase Obg [uncultured archaeon]